MKEYLTEALLVGAWACGFVMLGGLSTEACDASQVRTVETVAPIVVGAVCQLAADQGAAEPGWEVIVCQYLDAAGNVHPEATVMKLPANIADGLVAQKPVPLLVQDGGT